MANTSEFEKLTITSLPDSKGNFDIKDVRKDLERFVRDAIKSALPEGAFFKMGEKRLMPNGQVAVDVFFHSAEAGLAEASMRQQANELKHVGSVDPRYEVSASSPVSDRQTRVLINEEKKQLSEDAESTRFHKSTLVKIVAIITAIANITRRILSSVMAFSQQTAKDMLTANNLSMSYESVRHARHVESVHNLREGTITGGVSDVQTKFGNITSLDEGAIEALAVVMGSKVDEMVKVATSEQNPEKAMGMILDAFMEKANSGYNSVGQYVGEANARRELYSYLLKISPMWADIFATMQEEQHNINSIFKDKFDTYEEWQSMVNTVRNEPTPAQRNVSVIASEEWNLAKEAITQIKEAFLISLVPAVLRIARVISNIRWGMSEGEKEKLNEENYAKNEAFIKATDKTISMMEAQKDKLSPEQMARLEVLKRARDRAQKENESKGNISNVSMFAEEIQLAMESQLRRTAKAEETYAKWSSPETAEGYRLAGLTGEDVANTLKGYPAKEKELREKYEKAKQAFANKAIENRQKEVKTKREEQEMLQRIAWEDKEDVAWNEIDTDNYWQNTRLKAYRDAGGNVTNQGYFRSLLVAQKLYPDKDLFHDEKGKELSLKKAIEKARSLKVIEFSKSGLGLDILYDIKSQLSDEDLAEIRKANPTEWDMDFYDFAYQYDPMLFNKSFTDKKIRKQQKLSYLDPFYDLQNVFMKWGDELQGLSYLLPANTYTGKVTNIRAEDVKEGGVITHRLICDITANGEKIKEGFVLYDGVTNREGFTGNFDTTLTISKEAGMGWQTSAY